MKREILFRTVHGSRLYGMHHAASDYDYYTVVTKTPHARANWAKQKMSGADDTYWIDFSSWLRQCEKGVPQALEAMFSTQATEDTLSAYRAAYRVSTGVLSTYLRTLEAFALWDKEGALKRRRHAVRLALNIREFREFGRFHPTLSADDVAFIFDFEKAHPDGEALYEAARDLAMEI